MSYITSDSVVATVFELTWESAHAAHVERYRAEEVSFVRDILPLGLKSRMRGLGVGDSVEMAIDPSEIPEFKPGKVLDMPMARFRGPQGVRPRLGRFYPQHLIENVPGTRPDSDAPFRVVETDKIGFKADLNHPMAGRDVRIRARVLGIRPASGAGGTLRRWPDILFNGPGMQAQLPGAATDFFSDDPFSRDDESHEVQGSALSGQDAWLDNRARAGMTGIHAGLLREGMDILDLMAGRDSLLPEGLAPASVTGLGLSAKEMAANPALTASVIHNPNQNPELPFDEAGFDAVVCSASVEYLARPFAVFAEAARVLRPGGVFVLTFSNRWHGSGALRIWTELLEFERMGLVSQYFAHTEGFGDVRTISERGWPLPAEGAGPAGDKPSVSDPVYAVWARLRG
ncbi:methyltransferase domain-containing protein [Pseudodesulfovibrio sp. F-1]|uniref:Methyltransferase domain-containing protein n=1 Tax=Pseudodesulfovibrio alkaliphilus TaxID=2661613 RepID=A0A7K1KKV5_9BACT|nr:methyltransferase domain-containing protein [Pseudodesulfovibrio alkaliphilus]MUM76713.1 methyltransferase domain-containing protein [Pseudodesulfovibrio alkaliphilus]